MSQFMMMYTKGSKISEYTVEDDNYLMAEFLENWNMNQDKIEMDCIFSDDDSYEYTHPTEQDFIEWKTFRKKTRNNNG